MNREMRVYHYQSICWTQFHGMKILLDSTILKINIKFF